MKRLFTLIPVIGLLFTPGLFAQEQPDIEVVNIVICTSIEDREPVGSASVFSSDVGKLYCFTKVMGQTDTSSISHVWYYGDMQMAKINLNIGGKTWRTWSSKKLLMEWVGDWRVEIQDASGNVISEISFKIEL
jgi:hypothetical protein